MKAVVVMMLGEEARERTSEIISLCQTANYEVLEFFVQKGKPNRKYFIGKGKVSEIKDFLSNNNADTVVFENLLSSRQILSLEDEFELPVIDRFDLILNVFELHAKSREAKLQIELARLNRKLPYIKMFLSRKVKTEHPGFGGSGEFIIHSTLTTIHRRIKSIEKNLQRFENRAQMQRTRRKKIGKAISLAGYTNVGKTSLLYALTGVKRASKDELFTTLRSKTANLVVGGKRYLINDTIGFIRDIPFQLIYAFNATLMDIANSDLILIVHDASIGKEQLLQRKKICEKALLNIGANKAIWLDVENKMDIGKKHLENSIGVSAATGDGVETLKDEVHRLLHDGE
jgi:GTP-binding protein HflX